MVRQEQITVNGKQQPLSVCLDREINLNWRDIPAQQMGFQVMVLDEAAALVS